MVYDPAVQTQINESQRTTTGAQNASRLTIEMLGRQVRWEALQDGGEFSRLHKSLKRALAKQSRLIMTPDKIKVNGTI